MKTRRKVAKLVVVQETLFLRPTFVMTVDPHGLSVSVAATVPSEMRVSPLPPHTSVDGCA